MSDKSAFKDRHGDWRMTITLNLTETECLDMAAKYSHDDLFAVELRHYAALLGQLTELP